jgi:hypothetical protein
MTGSARIQTRYVTMPLQCTRRYFPDFLPLAAFSKLLLG